MRTRYILLIVLLLTLGFGAGRLSAATGTLDSPGPPGSTFSYTLENVYNRLNDGAAGVQSAFAEPAGGPASGTGHTLDEIMALAPAVDDTNGASASRVVTGTTYWSLQSGTWGLQTGAATVGGNVTGGDGQLTIAIPGGFYTGSKTATAQDADLVAGNIRSGANIFGIAGDSNVVNTSSGDATAGEILQGKRAWVDGTEIVGSGDPAPVPKTGQTECWDAGGTLLASCAGTGQDGEYRNGVAWPAPRFTDNGDGTVSDNLTGLIWLKNANCATFSASDTTGQNAREWSDALTAANSLADSFCGLTDGSVAGDWRLPNVREMQSLAHYGFDSFPAVPDTAGTGQWSEGDPFSGVQSDHYWSSTTYASDSARARSVGLDSGFVSAPTKTLTYYVWPVRDGQ